MFFFVWEADTAISMKKKKVIVFNMKSPPLFSMCTGLGFCVSAQTVCQVFIILPSSPFIDVPLTHKHIYTHIFISLWVRFKMC